MEDFYQNAKKICRLCLIQCDKYEVIERNIRNNIESILPNINLLLSEEPVICDNCAGIVKKCFHFKTMCLDAHKCIVSFISDKSNIKIDLKNIYLSKEEYATDVLNDHNICGFCMGLVKSCFAISLENEDNMLQKMSEKCFPELDFSIIKEPIICAPCHGHLTEYFSFVKNCLFMEEEIGKYCETLDIKNDKILIDLIDVLQFTLRNKVTGGEAEVQKLNNFHQFPLQNASLNIIGKNRSKIELQRKFCDGSGSIVEEPEEIKCDIETIVTIEDYKYDNTLFSTRIISEEVGVIQREGNFIEGQVVQKNEYQLAVEDQKYLVNDEIKIITDPQDFSSFQSDSSKPITSDDFLKNRKYSALDRPTEVVMYQCESCPYKTKRMGNLKRHSVVHKDPSKVTMYQCDSCPYQTERKDRLKRHLPVHKDTSEVIVYRCEFCSFQTKRKVDLKRHILVHTDPSKVTMYRCESCPYQTRHKDVLRIHMLVHKDPSKLTMYRCESCPYQSNRKVGLNNHLLVHKAASEVIMYQCESCPFQTKRKRTLDAHSFTHKDPSNVTMFRCESCPYQTKFKAKLKSHFLVHKDSSEAIMYQCESCPFQTKRKYYLKTHSLVHNDPSKVTMHRCESCPYQTKHKVLLKRHLLVHLDPSKVTIYRCESCPYQTKHKALLKSHLLVHNDTSKVIMYRCESCSYKTKHKSNLKKHSLVHKDPSKASVPM